MKISKIKIKNLFGIKEIALDDKSVEITGDNGIGKTSVLDAIKYALKNDSDRDYIIKEGAEEGEVIIETDTGISINRKKRTQGTDYKSIKEQGKEVQGPEAFLREIFTELQLDPVKFTQMSKNEQNRIILDLIEFDWDLNWIKEQFGEIPQGINYEQNILEVLNDIQADNSPYFMERQDVNRDIRNNVAFIAEIAADIPENYNAEKWEKFDLTSKLKELMEDKERNAKIEEAKQFIESYDNKTRGYKAQLEIDCTAYEKSLAVEREGLLKDNARMEAQIKVNNEKLAGLGKTLEDKKQIAQLEYEKKVAALDESITRAKEYAEKPTVATNELQAECDQAEEMKKHINEYNRMKELETKNEELKVIAEEFTRKIELARSLPRNSIRNSTNSNKRINCGEWKAVDKWSTNKQSIRRATA